MKRVLVTGGCGFIGSNFLRHFLQSHPDVSVVNLDKLTYSGNLANTKDFKSNKKYEFVQGDICDVALVGKLIEKVDAVVHFAAETHVDRSIDSAQQFVVTNVEGTNVLLEAARKADIKKFLHFSTDEVYGSCPKGSFRETDALNPTSPYSASKAASDFLALAYWKTHNLPVVLMRCTNNYGPFQYPEKVIPLFITNLIEEKKVPLYAKGENRRDWLYVEDCVDAVDFVLEKGGLGKIYNVAGGAELSNIELTREILKEFGKGDDSIQYVKDRAAHDFRYSIHSDELTKLGFSIKSKFASRLQETIQWYRDHRSWWEPLKKDTYTLK